MQDLKNIDAYKAMMVEFTDLGVEYALSFFSAVLILIAGYIVAGWAARAIRTRLQGMERFDNALVPVIVQIARYAILVVTLVLVLAEFGIQTTSIIAVLGAAGLAVGLALQGTLQNVAAGFMLLFIRPFTVGDFIESSAASGTVMEIGLFMTQLKTAQGVFMAVPNSKIWSDSITNYTRNPTRRMDLVFGISYEDDIAEARDVILGLAQKDDRILEEPAPITFVTNLGDSSVNIELRAWAKTEEFWNARWDLIREIKLALDKAGISIPYPHMQMVEPAKK